MQRIRKKEFVLSDVETTLSMSYIMSISFTKEGGKVDPSFVCTSHANLILCYLPNVKAFSLIIATELPVITAGAERS